MGRKRLSLRTRSILLVSLFMLTTNLALGIVLTKQAHQSTKIQINERMLDVANTAADMLEGDALEGLTEADIGTQKYQTAYDTLSCFLENIGLYAIYYVMDKGDGTFVFGIDPDPVKPAEFGSPCVCTDALYAAGKGTPSVDEVPYEDAWGRFYSAFSPVFTSDGKVAGIVAADFKAQWYEERVDQAQWTVIIGSSLSVLLSILITVLLVSQFSRQIGGIKDNVRELAQDLDALTNEHGGDTVAKITSDLDAYDIQSLGTHISELKTNVRNYITHTTTQANSMITAMASDYRCVYYVNFDENDAVCYREDHDDPEQTPAGEHFPYLERFTWYAENKVSDLYREGFLAFIDPDNVRKRLAAEPIIAYRYLVKRRDQEYYEMIRMAGVRRAEERDDHMVHAVGLGLTVIDAEMRESMAKNEALAEALVVAEEASKAKTAFLSSMSHEIRTPMNAIIGLDTLALKDETLSAQTRDYLEKINGSARHLLALINDILDMSRIESGRIVLNKEAFLLSKVLEQINTMVMSQCSDKGLTYECRLLNQMEDCYIGDETRLKEVLINILSNAVKFTDAPGSITLTVEKTASFQDQSTLKFCIRDTGIGMDPEYIPKIFEPFSQEDSSRKNKYGSTGLGMAITRNIVEMMNGTISVESEKGVGSEFTVTVTLKRGEQKETVLLNEDDHGTEGGIFGEGTRPRSDEVPRVPLAGRRILLAEDTEVNAEIMMDLLSIEDVEADHAKNGRIAVSLFAQSEVGTYDAILMDIRMPEMDGLEAACAIRALDRPDARKIPIIALTANAFDEDVQRSLQAGMNAHLSKPVDSDLLYQTLGELIYKAQSDQRGTDG